MVRIRAWMSASKVFVIKAANGDVGGVGLKLRVVMTRRRMLHPVPPNHQA